MRGQQKGGGRVELCVREKVVGKPLRGRAQNLDCMLATKQNKTERSKQNTPRFLVCATPGRGQGVVAARS